MIWKTGPDDKCSFYIYMALTLQLHHSITIVQRDGGRRKHQTLFFCIITVEVIVTSKLVFPPARSEYASGYDRLDHSDP